MEWDANLFPWMNESETADRDEKVGKRFQFLTRVTGSRGLVPSSGVFFFFWRELSLQLHAAV